MKKKLSISVEEKTIKEIENCVSEGYFRNKSHVIEFAVNKFVKDKEDE